MKTPNRTYPTTPVFRSRIKILALAAGLITIAGTGFAQTLWQGGTSDYNVPASWSGAYNTGNPNCTDDSGSNNVVLIQPGDPVWFHGDTLAGNGANTSGAYLQTGSTNNTGYPNNGNWLRLGIGTGSAGYYVLSNGTVNVAGQTHLGEKGTGYLEVDGGVYNTGYNGNPGICAGDGDFGVSTGTLVLNGGTINNINNETWFGENNGCTGYFFMNGGNFNPNNWFVFGRNSGSTGYGVMTGGTITFTGGGDFLIGGGGVGALAQSGGTITAYNQYLIPQGNGGNTGRGTNTVSGTAVLNVHDWLAVGRGGGYGELDISGSASITRDNINNGHDSNSHFDIGAGGTGVVNQNGGSITELTSDLWLGETASGTWNFNSGTATVKNVVMDVNSSATAQLNLNGGLFQATSITSPTTGDVSILSLNGATLQANANTTTFISGLFQASVGSSGVTIDSQGYTITVPQALTDNGGGTLTKVGSGILNLTGANTYAGATAVNAGTLATTTASTGGGAFTVANGATLNVQVAGGLNSQITMPNLTFSGSNTNGIDLNNFGNPSSAPINVTGTLTVGGTLTINISDENPQIGEFPLISYASKTGSSYVLGTLPIGVIAHLVDNTASNSIDLDITSINLPRWDGNAGGNWDIGVTTNWVNLGTGLPTFYQQGNAVTFNDSATGTTTVNLVAAVTPGSITIDNNSLVYTLNGTGSINGAIGVTMNGTSSFTINTTNGYTGPTTINAGILAVGNVANGGSASALGASSANPTNLVISDATFSYVGSGGSMNRGYMLENTNCMMDIEGNLAISGVAATFADGDFIKTGPAQLTYTTVGVNALSGVNSAGYRTIAGTTKFDGSAGGQTNNVLGHFGVGGLGGTNASVILTNSILNVSGGGIDLGRSGGAVGTLTVGGSAVLNSTSGNFALGDGNGTVSTGVVNQVGGTVNVSGPQMFVGQNISGVGSYTISGGALNINNWLAVGRQGGSGVLTITGGSLTKNGNGNLDIGTSAGIGGFDGTGVLNQSGGAITNTTQTWLGEGATGEPANGTWNMTGGTAHLGELHIGQGGTGTNVLNISGSSTITCGFLGLSLADTNTIGNLNMTGGTITVNSDMTVGDQGTGNLNFTPGSGAQLTVNGTLYLSRSSQQANGTVNLNAGNTLITSYLNNGWGFHNNYPSPTNNPNAFNFNGGTLRANTSSGFFIQPYVNAIVQSGGAIIDDGGNSIAVLTGLVDGGGGGGLTKQGSGIMYLIGTNTYTGTTLISTGALAGTGTIAGPVTVASGGALGAGWNAIGTLTISNSLTFQAGSTSFMKIGTSSFDQIAGLTSVAYSGTLVVTNTTGGSITGNVYPLFRSGSPGTGNFTSITVLPSGSATFNPATGQLTITSSGAFTFNPVTTSSGNLILTGSGGTAGGGYTLLSATNIATPFASWTTNTTGTFSGTGTFSNAIPINAAQPGGNFFRIRTP